MNMDRLDGVSPDDPLFTHAEQREPDGWFCLRGQSINPMIDAATPLLGLVQRVRLLSRYDRVAELYQRVVTEIQAIEQELLAKGYEHGMVLSFRYILCTFIDEAVMGRDWGSDSEWSEHSLLIRFHNEAWGGEKAFVLLAHLQEEPARYRDLLAFIYLCLCLGFEGRYRVMSQGRDEFERLVKRLHSQLASGASAGNGGVLHLDLGQQAARVSRRKPLSLGLLWAGAALCLLVAFGFYHHALDQQTQALLRQLGELLQ